MKCLAPAVMIFALATLVQSQDKLPGPDEFIAVDSMPQMIENVPPVYPDAVKKARIEGDVMIKALVDTNGSVVKVIVGKTSGNESLDSAAVQATYKNKFTPAKQGGKPVAVWVAYKVKFDLGDKTDEES